MVLVPSSNDGSDFSYFYDIISQLKKLRYTQDR